MDIGSVWNVGSGNGWRGEKAGCNRPQEHIITEGQPAVYFRTDYVAVELKKFSVREVEPLP